jgi:hypothetical protein
MGRRSEIGWTTLLEDGSKRHVYAERHGKAWRFFERIRRKGKEVEWQPVDNPGLGDWQELLDAMERRVARDLHSPDELDRIKNQIRDYFPAAQPGFRKPE